MADEYCYTQIGIITILMIALAAAFTAFVFISGLESNAGPFLMVVGFAVVGLFIFALAACALNSFFDCVPHCARNSAQNAS